MSRKSDIYKTLYLSLLCLKAGHKFLLDVKLAPTHFFLRKGKYLSVNIETISRWVCLPKTLINYLIFHHFLPHFYLFTIYCSWEMKLVFSFLHSILSFLSFQIYMLLVYKELWIIKYYYVIKFMDRLSFAGLIYRPSSLNLRGQIALSVCPSYLQHWLNFLPVWWQVWEGHAAKSFLALLSHNCIYGQWLCVVPEILP